MPRNSFDGGVRWRPAASIVLIGAALSAVQCSGISPVAPPPPALSATCPANVTVQSPDGSPVPVTFNLPSSTGGVAPVTASCSVPAGSLFSVGSTTVPCQVQDGRGQVAMCTFTVVVQPPPRLVGTRFVAFGDSLTEGVLSPSVTALIVSPPHSYPFLLQAQLVSRYRQQAPVILNEGIGGERAAVGGIQRFRSVVQRHRPDIVLLMEGTNDLLALDAGANAAIDALRVMVREAKAVGARVGLATVPPQRSGGLRLRDNVARIIPGFNDRIRALAAAEDVVLIDVYNGMKDDLTLIGIDDLHPTARGYQVIADVFFEAIKGGFEQPLTSSTQGVGIFR